MDFFVDAHQYAKINQAERSADTAAEKASRAQDSYYKLLKKQEKMALVSQALLEIVQERLGVSDEELENKILEIDLRDGSADGKIGGQVVSCKNCGRKTNTQRGSCFYCGTKTAEGHAFE